MGYTYRHSAAADDLIFTSAVFEGVPSPGIANSEPKWIRCSITAKRFSR